MAFLPSPRAAAGSGWISPCFLIQQQAGVLFWVGWRPRERQGWRIGRCQPWCVIVVSVVWGEKVRRPPCRGALPSRRTSGEHELRGWTRTTTFQRGINKKEFELNLKYSLYEYGLGEMKVGFLLPKVGFPLPSVVGYHALTINTGTTVTVTNRKIPYKIYQNF